MGLTKYYEAATCDEFVGRTYELSRLAEIVSIGKPAILVVYGRRRVGKTELLEQAFKNRNILKFEGIEGADANSQRQHIMRQLAYYFQEPLLEKVIFSTWSELLIAIYEKIKDQTVTLYFEELQWIANYDAKFIAELKYVWDNFFKKNKNLILILCGSSASFMINKVLKSQALYNRSQHEMYLAPFTFTDAAKLLHTKSMYEVLDAYLAIGGIPAYLNVLNTKQSCFISLCKQSFTQDGFFVHEYERIFTSALANNKHYRQVIEFLANKSFATREEIVRHLKISTGGSLSTILIDLLKSDFIEKYSPYNLASSSHLARYAIKDQYLQFYYKFIQPIKDSILRGDYNDNPIRAINKGSFNTWQGFAFERFCRSNHRLIAKRLGFALINYMSGSFYNRATNSVDPNFQIDLLFDRDDKVITICEIKYLQNKVGSEVIDEFSKKLDLFPNPKNKTVCKVLITVNGASDTLVNRNYFDDILELKDFYLQ